MFLTRNLWSLGLGMAHVLPVLVADGMSRGGMEVSSALLPFHVQLWLVGGGVAALAWLAWPGRLRWLVWGLGLSFSLHAVSVVPLARYLGQYPGIEMLGEGWFSLRLVGVWLDELKPADMALLVVTAVWHGWLAWGLLDARKVADGAPPLRTVSVWALTLACLGGLVLSAADMAGVRHPLVQLAQAGAPDRLRFGAFQEADGDGQALAQAALQLAGNRPNVVFIVLRSVGARQLLPSGELDVRQTPNLKRLQDEGGVLFDTLYAPAPDVLRANLALNTGGQVPTWMPVASAATRPWRGPLLARELGKAGYRTGLFSDWDLAPHGLDRFLAQGGYQAFVHPGRTGAQEGKRPGGREVSMVNRAVDWLRQGSQPFFLHFMTDAAPEDFRPAVADSGQHVLTHVDATLGRLLSAVERAGLRDRTVFVITGDHGDPHGGERDEDPVSRAYDEVMRSFALFGLPSRFLVPRRAERVAGIGNLYSSVLALAGVPPLGSPPQSLFDRHWHPRLQFFQYRQSAGAWGLRDGRWKVIFQSAGAPALHDLAADPEEKRNLLEKHPRRMKLYDELCAVWFLERNRQFASWQNGYPAPDLTVDELSSFGIKLVRLGHAQPVGDADFDILPARRFHPDDSPFVETLWSGFPKDNDIEYLWLPPGGDPLRQTVSLDGNLRLQRFMVPLPRPMQEGNWTLRISGLGQVLRELRFQVSVSAAPYPRAAPGLLVAGTGPRLTGLEVGAGKRDFGTPARIHPEGQFSIRSRWHPGLHDAYLAYELESPRGQTMMLPFTLAAGESTHLKTVQPPVSMWQGTWKLRLAVPDSETAEATFEVKE